MSGIRIIFIDVDGTITENRNTYLLDLELIKYLRRLVEKGVYVSIISSNAVPVVIGLARYLGLNGPVAGESGSLVYHDEWGLVSLARSSSHQAYVDVLERFADYVDDSWQNRFRIHEYALKVKKGLDGWKVFRMVKEYVESKYGDIEVGYSGYAIHLIPRGINKGVAVEYVLERLNIDSAHAAGVGDSVMDVEIMKHVKYRVAVGNADEELKKTCNIIMESPSGRGVLEFVKKVLEGGF